MPVMHQLFLQKQLIDMYVYTLSRFIGQLSLLNLSLIRPRKIHGELHGIFPVNMPLDIFLLMENLLFWKSPA
jgi:hypothetical protein